MLRVSYPTHAKGSGIFLVRGGASVRITEASPKVVNWTFAARTVLKFMIASSCDSLRFASGAFATEEFENGRLDPTLSSMKRLGVGAYGTVIKAKYNNEDVAIKIFNKGWESEMNFWK